MSGTLNDGVLTVHIVYRGEGWTEDDAERLIAKPVLEAMFTACQKIAAEYSTPDCTIAVV